MAAEIPAGPYIINQPELLNTFQNKYSFPFNAVLISAFKHCPRATQATVILALMRWQHQGVEGSASAAGGPARDFPLSRAARPARGGQPCFRSFSGGSRVSEWRLKLCSALLFIRWQVPLSGFLLWTRTLLKRSLSRHTAFRITLFSSESLP